jgi:hypothetical protein
MLTTDTNDTARSGKPQFVMAMFISMPCNLWHELRLVAL